MAKNDNLTDFLTDVANAIRNKEGSSSAINPQDFSARISALSSGGSSSSFKIKNKLNGAFFGGASFKGESTNQYEFEGGTLDGLLIAFFKNKEMGEVAGITKWDVFPPRDNSVAFINMDFESSYDSGRFYIRTKARISSYFGVMDCLLYSNGLLRIICNGDGFYPSISSASFIVLAWDTDGNVDTDYFYAQGTGPCILKNTPITLSDGSTKYIQHINYNDELKVWNFDEGKYDSSKILWIKKTQKSAYYYKAIFNDGSYIGLMGSNGKCHRLFSVTKQRFEYAVDCVGEDIYTENGIKKLISCDLIEEECEYYNIITEHHMNMFANGVLTSCRYNNLYPINDMKFVKDDRLERNPKWKVYAEKFRPHEKILGRYIEGLRLYEQLDIPIEDTVEYVSRLEKLRKRLEDFEENKEVLEDIDETNVGWIDPEGNVYGYRLYMPGQYNHITLANIICKRFGFEDSKIGGFSRTLEKKGWVKYTNEFLSAPEDKEITDRQERKIHKFVTNNAKVKKRGGIKMGSIFGDENTIDYIKMMPKKDLNKKMKGK